MVEDNIILILLLFMAGHSLISRVRKFHTMNSCKGVDVKLHAVLTSSQNVFEYVKGKGKVDPVLLTEHYAMNVYWGMEV
jgi:hypothetical protein